LGRQEVRSRQPPVRFLVVERILGTVEPVRTGLEIGTNAKARSEGTRRVKKSKKYLDKTHGAYKAGELVVVAVVKGPETGGVTFFASSVRKVRRKLPIF
jgi:hypothetical protein